MKFIIIGKNIDVTPGLKQAVESKLGKLERYFTPETEIHVTLSVQKEHQKIEVTIPVKGTIIRSEQVSSDMYVPSILSKRLLNASFANIRINLLPDSRKAATLNRNFSIPQRIQMKTRSRSSAQKNSASNQCIQKMHASRWNCSDTISTYSATQRPKKST